MRIKQELYAFVIKDHLEKNISLTGKKIKIPTEPVAEKNDEGEVAFYTLKIPHLPCGEATTYATIGLAKYSFPRTKDESGVELVYSIYTAQDTDKIRKHFNDAGRHMVSKEDSPYVSGDAAPLIDTFGNDMKAFFFLDPIVYFPEKLKVVKDISPTVNFLWFFPITGEELKFIEEYGSTKFFELVVEMDPDLMDINRESLVRKKRNLKKMPRVVGQAVAEVAVAAEVEEQLDFLIPKEKKKKKV